MSGLGRTLADLDLRNARAMSAAQDRYETAPEDPEEYTSMQPIGCGETLVCYTVDAGIVQITGAYIGADVVEPEGHDRLLGRHVLAGDRDRAGSGG